MAISLKPKLDDELEKLLEVQWRGISFPIKAFSTEITQDHAVHKYVDRDGARVEATGRNPMNITGTAIFSNHISPGKSESWKKGKLFPNVYNKFILAMADRATGTLQHPILGNLKCKPVSCKDSLAGEVRDGVVVEFAFIETIDDEKDALDLLKSKLSKLGSVKSLAASLDTQLPKIPTVKIPKGPDFAEFARNIQAIIDKPTLFAKKGLGQIDALVFRCNNVIAALKRANNVAHGKAINDATALKADAAELRKQLLVQDKTIVAYITKDTTSFTQLSGQLKNSLDDLIKLNPNLLSSAIVPKNALVRYYKV
jgi:prophage DNA circulation protein